MREADCEAHGDAAPFVKNASKTAVTLNRHKLLASVLLAIAVECVKCIVT